MPTGVSPPADYTAFDLVVIAQHLSPTCDTATTRHPLPPAPGSLTLLTAERLVGALLGQALGDALGFVVEAAAPEAAAAYVQEYAPDRPRR